MDLDALADVDAGAVGGGAHRLLAADQDRRAELVVDEAHRGADRLLLLALGEDDALRRAADALEDALQRADDRVAAGGELHLVGGHVGDRLARDARFHRRLGHRRRDLADQARVEGHRDDVVRAEFRPEPLIGGGHLVGHVLAGERGERLRRGDLHRRR